MIIRESRDQLAFNQSPGLIAVFHALHRLLAPRHPPHALSSLAALIPSPIGFHQPRKRSCFKPLVPTPMCWDKSNDPFHSQGSCRVICEATLTATELSKNQSCHDRWAGARALASAAARTQISWSCGDDRDRTGNLRLAKPALSQLSYVPFSRSGVSGQEPDTRRSNSSVAPFADP